jgi:ubiquinone/menaquinone biosynthesis C-methylase UbiE
MMMIDDVSDIASQYNSDPGREDNRLDRHQLEHDLTWRYLDRYLPPLGPSTGSILEVGPATGRYTVELARRGFQVTAVDLSEQLLALCRRRVKNAGLAGRVRLLVGDARDLHAVEGKFDLYVGKKI